jgi:two-component system, sensor histidine kinase and response regulator
MRTTILLVDDRVENLFSLESILEQENRMFIHAASGEAALKVAAEEKPALILLDYQMPGMNGIETALHLRANESTAMIPVLFVTALTKNDYQQFGQFEEGTVDIISKPLNISEVRNKVALFEKLAHYQAFIQDHGLVMI